MFRFKGLQSTTKSLLTLSIGCKLKFRFGCTSIRKTSLPTFKFSGTLTNRKYSPGG